MLDDAIANRNVEKQAAALAKNLDLVLKGSEPLAYKTDVTRMLPIQPLIVFNAFWIVLTSLQR